MGDEYLRVALSSDEEFAKAKVAEGIVRQRTNVFELLLAGDDHIVILRRH